jgi:hypothetical protein
VANNHDIQYKIVPPWNLGRGQRREIYGLIGKSTELDRPSGTRDDTEEARLRIGAGRTIGAPNKGIGGSFLRRQQAYARSLNILALLGGETIAYLPVADKVSTERTGLRGATELQAKLRIPELGRKKLINERYIWLGYAALSPNVHREILEDPQNVNPLDIMIAIAARRYDSRQPVVASPRDEELVWKTELLSIGLQRQSDRNIKVYVFGEDAPPVCEEYWLARSMRYVNAQIMAKEGAAAAIEAALWQMQA